MKTQRWLGSAILLLVLCAGAIAAPVTYQVTTSYSNVGFSIYEFLVTKQEGVFRDFNGEIVYDKDHPEQSHVQITVQAASVDTRNGTRDRAVRSTDYLDVEKYPTLSFVSTNVAPAPGGVLAVTGNFTLHGVSRQITIPVRLLGEHEVPTNQIFAGFETTFDIDRSDYGVIGGLGGNLPLGKAVTIHLSIGARRQTS
jgi:polyisoprenoid-binding protein YceI